MIATRALTGGSISPEAEGRSRRRRAQCGVHPAASSQTDPQPPLSSRGSVARGLAAASQFALRAHPTRRLWRGRITRRTSYRRFIGDFVHSSPLRRGATEPPGAQPSPKLPADAKGAQRAKCPHPNHIVLLTTDQSGNSPLHPYLRRRSVPAASSTTAAAKASGWRSEPAPVQP